MSDTQKKQFCTQFNKLVSRRSSWEVWNDFLTMSSAALANVFPHPEQAEREERYLSIINSYEEQERNIFPELLGFVTLAFEENPEQDFLGEIYGELQLSQHQKGQYFTPYHMSKFMAEIQFCDSCQQEIERKGYISISDPACGSGVMLIAFANCARAHDINYQEQVLFVAQDIDSVAAKMCFIQLSLLGCPACVIIGDTLVKPGFHPDNEVYYTPFYWLNSWRFKRNSEGERVSMAVQQALETPEIRIESAAAFLEEDGRQFRFEFQIAS